MQSEWRAPPRSGLHGFNLRRGYPRFRLSLASCALTVCGLWPARGRLGRVYLASSAEATFTDADSFQPHGHWSALCRAKLAAGRSDRSGFGFCRLLSRVIAKLVRTSDSIRVISMSARPCFVLPQRLQKSRRAWSWRETAAGAGHVDGVQPEIRPEASFPCPSVAAGPRVWPASLSCLDDAIRPHRHCAPGSRPGVRRGAGLQPTQSRQALRIVSGQPPSRIRPIHDTQNAPLPASGGVTAQKMRRRSNLDVSAALAYPTKLCVAGSRGIRRRLEVTTTRLTDCVSGS